MVLPQPRKPLDELLQTGVKGEADQADDQDYGGKAIVFQGPRIVNGVTEARLHAEILGGDQHDPAHAKREPDPCQDVLRDRRHNNRA